MSKRARPETRRTARFVWTSISKRTLVLFVLSLIGSSLALASASVETPNPSLLRHPETRLNPPTVVAKATLP
ncbi:MAG TPA: hypothetical protein V6D26_28205, partial [Stenomitos sp.]